MALALASFAALFSVAFLDGTAFSLEAVAAWAFENFVLAMRALENGTMKSKKQSREHASREGVGSNMVSTKHRYTLSVSGLRSQKKSGLDKILFLSELECFGSNSCRQGCKSKGHWG